MLFLLRFSLLSPFFLCETVEFSRYRYIEGSLPILFLVYLSSFVSIGDPYLFLFGPIRKYFIISVFAIQYRWVFHTIYMPLFLSVLSGSLVEYSNGRFFFSGSAFMNENKGVSHYDLAFISMGCIFFSLISFFFLFLSFY